MYIKPYLFPILNAVGLSVDWINDKVYWTDKFKLTLEVYDIKTRTSKVVFQFEGDHPQGLGVFPFTGKGCVRIHIYL